MAVASVQPQQAPQQAPSWHQPMPAGFNGMSGAYPGHPGNTAQPATPLSQNRATIRVLLVIAILTAAMVGILFTEIVLV